jgi:aryl-alcohol dehydrogenase-like predicted oxidoreductase
MNRDFRGSAPRFQGDNLDKNLALVEKLRKIADRKRINVAQLAIAWVLEHPGCCSVTAFFLTVHPCCRSLMATEVPQMRFF